ncbi:MAG TPA: hypothetical protein VEL77_15140 [Rugosimonospora sp.]|nr:hypothetical protein [Rugosimonospora sp.]
MNIVNSAKGELVQTVLRKIVDGNTGSTLLGGVAVAILASGASFPDLFSTDQSKLAHAWGLAIGGAILGVWGWKIGRKPVAPAPPAV